MNTAYLAPFRFGPNYFATSGKPGTLLEIRGNKMNRKKTIVVATATYNLAETQRMVQIASEVKKGGIFNVIVTYYTPLDAPYSFAKIIKEEGLDDALLTPLMTKELAEYIYAVDREKKTGAFIPYNILKERVNNEIDFLKSNDVACVVTGFCLSFFVSARILDIPVVSVLSGSMFWWLQQDPNLARIPDMMSTGPMKLIPQSIIERKSAI